MPTEESLLLSREKLVTFLACQRRFQLRYLAQLPWPQAPLAPEAEAAVRRGQEFHRLLHQYFLQLPLDTVLVTDEKLQVWWQRFRAYAPAIPEGHKLPELTLTVPIDGHFLVGRFDLLVLGETAEGPSGHLFDWKTGDVQDAASLREAWQTKLYLAMLAEGGTALTTGGRELTPEHISLTYWFATAPEAPLTIGYDQTTHEASWQELRLHVKNLGTSLEKNVWPLTENWEHCRACAYQILCERQAAGAAASTAPEEASIAADVGMEPDVP